MQSLPIITISPYYKIPQSHANSRLCSFSNSYYSLSADQVKPSSLTAKLAEFISHLSRGIKVVQTR